ncbi:MAG: deoxycytidylate deaminase [Alphaproteobacteria bacterium]|nr:deoxycytidylate deaminase [Alphaproteobacteria bacterium]
MNDPYLSIQSAVDVVLTSPHPENKVAACLFNQEKSLTRTNEWPAAIFDKIGTTRIGDSSGTIHAEVNCLLHFEDRTDGTEIAITDPCCPNCAKSIAESGIKTVYIDHKGFLKDFAIRRGNEFQDMSLSIMAHAGISIYEINRKEKKIGIIYQPEQGYIPPEDNPIEIIKQIIPATPDSFQNLIDNVRIKHPSWGCAFATNQVGEIFSLVASSHAAVGFSQERFEKEGQPSPQAIDGKKYSFYLSPLNRLLFGAAKHGLKLMETYIWTSVTPTSRELVNLVGAGYKTLAIGDIDQCDTTDPQDKPSDAISTLKSAGIMTFYTLKRT